MPVTDHVWVCDSKIQRRVRCLAYLRPWCQIDASYQVEARRRATLAVRHESHYTGQKATTPAAADDPACPVPAPVTTIKPERRPSLSVRIRRAF